MPELSELWATLHWPHLVGGGVGGVLLAFLLWKLFQAAVKLVLLAVFVVAVGTVVFAWSQAHPTPTVAPAPPSMSPTHATPTPNSPSVPGASRVP
jgi:hypothetical protein